ncbi:MAG: hypothetical protein WD043_00970 [Gemmatimonadales bacterium]
MVRRLGLVAAGLVLAGCLDDQALNPPPLPEGGELFSRYVAFGNSITAGYQAGGLDSTLQAASYAVLLAEQMGTTFYVPWMRVPGCPPPITNIFTLTRVHGLTGGDCALRTDNVPPWLNLVAVPGASVIDVLTNYDATSDPNTLTTFLLGGLSQLGAARRAQPTFISVWIGNNDVLGALINSVNPGDSTLVTPPATFATTYARLMDSLDAIGTIQGGVLLGVAQVTSAPYLTQGRLWEQFEADFDATTPVNVLDVVNCTAFQPLGGADTAWASVPFPTGGAALAMAQARLDSLTAGSLAPGDVQPAVIDCSADHGVSVPEMVFFLNAVTQYNAAIAAEAAARDWLYFDPNVPLAQLLADPTAIRPFPTFTDQANAHPFGTALSADGLHPSSATHRLLATLLISAINAAFETAIPGLD